MKEHGLKALHELDKDTYYSVCSSCKVIIDDGVIISGKYYCYECELEGECSK